MTKKEISHIMQTLRKGTLAWTGRANCYRAARKQVFVRIGKSGQKIFKFHWQCARCKEWFRNQDDLEVDHIKEIGGYKGCWNSIIGRMFDEANLQLLCTVCHAKKTASYAATFRYTRKK